MEIFTLVSSVSFVFCSVGAALGAGVELGVMVTGEAVPDSFRIV